MLIKRGDVARVYFPNSDLVSAKRRLALVVQADNLATGLSQILLAMITSNLNRANHLSRVLVNLDSLEGRASGLRTDSIIMTDNIVTVLETEIDSVLGRLSNMEAVNNALRHSFGLNETAKDFENEKDKI
ncbi:MAG: type II toxin-antitoxin system PemK/MazF family toxin [Pyrinomonadaceae bacterium]|nr:type II toxin-antitoxin system PemK/MazF family toxin [Pyrinomonadaceae bacterium]